MSSTALLTWGLGPVQTFIAQARRIADVWAGSYLLSHLTRQAIGVVHRDPACQMVFPYLLPDEPIPNGLPNRFVCRVPAERAGEIARAMEAKVEQVWDFLVKDALAELAPYGIVPSSALWAPREAGRPRQTDAVFQISWSWVLEDRGYAAASFDGAERFAASRQFRSFRPIAEEGVKCALCGERTALPDGEGEPVRTAWRTAEETAHQRADGMARYFRFKQGRLCLACATKRFFPIQEKVGEQFQGFDRFQESESLPYFAIVKLDGDRLGRILSLEPEQVHGGALEELHREVSQALSRFARSLRSEGSAALNLDVLAGYQDHEPRSQLIYAGGDDVLFVCNPLDALPLAELIHDHYERSLAPARHLLRDPEASSFTISAAVIFAHRANTAGLLLHDLEALLKERAKAQGGRNAVAIRLHKRSGSPTEVVLPWGDRDGLGRTWTSALQELAEDVAKGEVSSRQTFTLREGEQVLGPVLGSDPELWQRWLAGRLSRNAGTAEAAERMAARLAPFFLHRRTAALRIARFLGRELQS